MSGVDERVETVREGFGAHWMLWQDDPNGATRTAVDDPACPACLASAALDSLAAAVAGLEQRADDAEKALRSEHEWTCGCIEPGNPSTCNLAETFAALAAAVVSAEPTP